MHSIFRTRICFRGISTSSRAIFQREDCRLLEISAPSIRLSTTARIAGFCSVVKPDFGTSVDSFLYYYYYPGQPTTFFSHSSLVPDGQTVLSPTQTNRLGQALDAIHEHFAPLYQVEGRFYAMDVEFKFDDLDTGEAPSLWVKQARPHYGWGDGAP